MSTNPTISAISNYLTEKNVGNVVVLSDENVDNYYGNYFSELSLNLNLERIILPAGEKCKTFDNIQNVLHHFVEKQYDKDLVVINFGGGAVCDFGGFLASIYKRGVKYLNVPTTLLAMIDASIGGKTAINLDHIKNCVGTYHFPSFIAPIDLIFLNTLPSNEFFSGIGELVKYAIIGSNSLFNELSKVESFNVDNLNLEWLNFCVEFKMEIIGKDPYDRDLRRVLNFGHTVGHAIESWSHINNQPIAHGIAVAHGVLYESYISHLFYELPESSWLNISHFLSKHFQLLNFNQQDVEILLDLMQNDKKNSNNQINFTLLSEIGKAAPNVMLNRNQVESALLNLTKKS